eukprot:3131029-Pleurochrysis_carterae.AAC.1
MKKKTDRVAVMTTPRPCMMAMLSEGCARAMALSTVGLVHMSISSQQSLVHAACALAYAQEVRMPVVRGRSRSVVDVS